MKLAHQALNRIFLFSLFFLLSAVNHQALYYYYIFKHAAIAAERDRDSPFFTWVIFFVA